MTWNRRWVIAGGWWSLRLSATALSWPTTALRRRPPAPEASQRRNRVTACSSSATSSAPALGGLPGSRASEAAHCRTGCSRAAPVMTARLGQGLAPAGDVVGREAFHDPHRVSSRQREVQRDGRDQGEAVASAGHVRDVGQQLVQLLRGDLERLGEPRAHPGLRLGLGSLPADDRGPFAADRLG